MIIRLKRLLIFLYFLKFMSSNQSLKEKLLEFSKEEPNRVRHRLELGEEISANLHAGCFVYFIDDIEIYKRIGNSDDPNEFYLAVGQALKPISMENLPRVFPSNERINGRIKAPFSRTVNERLGDCLEKSILVQLGSQVYTDSFLITGLFLHDEIRRFYPHAFNIVYHDGISYLVDAQNPVIFHVNETRTEVSYAVPVSGFDGKKFEIEERWRLGRSYFLDFPIE